MSAKSVSASLGPRTSIYRTRAKGLGKLTCCDHGGVKSNLIADSVKPCAHCNSSCRQRVRCAIRALEIHVQVSVVIPCYNEVSTVLPLVESVLAAPFDKELILVDDGSTDGTRQVLEQQVATLPGVRVFFQERNLGKGAALRRGFQEAHGDIVIVQDADLEYDPVQIPTVIAPIVEGHADVVFGSRFLGGPHRVLYFWHSVGNSLLTLFSNMVSDLNLTDMETCYKAFRREIIQSLVLEEDRFGFEPEVTVKLSRKKGIRIYEIPISYRGRTYEDGKKISAKDGFRALWCLAKYGILRK